MKKVCATCGQEKDASEFTFRKDRGTYESRCRTCKNAASRERWARKVRKETEGEKEAIERDPCGFFAADIIELAILDWRRYSDLDVRHRDKTEYKSTRALIRKQGFKTIREELLAFFDSAWFEELCDAVGVAPEYIRKHIGDVR